MLKKILFFLLITTTGFSQSPAGIWYFGKNAGINFNLGNNPVSINDGQLNTNEGCATLCDNSGNLLFYTDGIKVWNKNHLVMPNGTGLLGDSSSTQSAIIVPKPNSSTLFYVFTVDELGKSNGLQYSIIDLSLDGGLGDIITKNVPLQTPALEKITTVQHANGIDFWVIAHKYGNNQFVSYLLSATGLTTTPVISAVGSVIMNDSQRTLGYLKSSPDGEYVAIAHSGTNSNVQLLKFNTASGQLTLLSNMLVNSNSLGAYGIEFSSNSKVLYVSRIDYPSFTSEIFQYNLAIENESTINSSRITIANYVFDSFNEGIITALQLAPNQKIYVARNNSGFLDVINNPNTVGLGCQYALNAVDLFPNTAYFGLPSFITSYLDLNFISSNFCIGNPTQFLLPQINDIVSVTWNFGDTGSSSNISFDDNPVHTYTSTGNYTVTLTVQTLTNTKVFTQQIKIIASPIANLSTNFKKCEETPNKATFILSQKNNEILGTQLPANYSVSYHASQNDADSNSNPLTNTYINSSNPQTIFARIQPVTGGVCYDTTSFQLIVNTKPALSPDANEYYCLNYAPQKKTISAGNLNPSEVLTYLWSTGENTESIEVSQSGNYIVTATNSNGCTSSRTITVMNSEVATINYTILGNIGDNSLYVQPIGSGNYTHSLDNEFGPFQISSVFNSLNSGNHIIYVKDENGCGIASKIFSITGFPNFFTPNGDGNNDFWNLQGSFIDVKITLIYDRFGKLITSVKPNSAGWDGTYKGVKMPSTDYWFLATLRDGSEFKGHFSLKR